MLSVAAVLTFERDESSAGDGASFGSGAADGATRIRSAATSLGAVAATVVRADAAENFLVGKSLDAGDISATIADAARLAVESASPIDDVRGGAAYRTAMVETLVARALRRARSGLAGLRIR